MPTNLLNPLANSNLATPGPYDNLVNVWTGEVLGQYHANLAVNRMLRKVTLERGKTAQFMLTGRVGYQWHDSGEELRGMDQENMTRTFSLFDRPITSQLEYEDLVDLVTQNPTERQYRTMEIAYALSKGVEIESLKMVAQAAGEANPANVSAGQFYGGYGDSNTFDGTGISGTFGADASGAREVLAAIKNYVKALEKNNMSPMGLICFVDPDIWYEIRQLDGIAASDSNNDRSTAGGVGIYNDLDINPNPIHFSQYLGLDAPLEYLGVKIMRHQLFSGSADNSEGFAKDRSNDRENAGNYSGVKGLIFNPQMCTGFIQKLGPQLVIQKPDRGFTELVIGRVWFGGGTLRPEYACALHDGTWITS